MCWFDLRGNSVAGTLNLQVSERVDLQERMGKM